jgi:uncharacterized lipoprotein YajG
MRRASFLLLHLCTFLLAGCAHPVEQEEPKEAPPVMTPEASAARISATILSRKVQTLRKEALYLRYRIEGDMLLKELTPSENSSSASSNSL